MPLTPSISRTISAIDFGLLVLLGAAWGAVYVFVRIAGPEIGPIWVAEARIALAALILGAIAGRRTWAIARSNPRGFVVAGATFSAIPFSLIAVAALTLPSGFGALLNASTPLFTALLGVALLGQPLSRRVTAGIVVGVGAVFVLVGWSPLSMGPATLVAVVAALGAALSYAFAGTYVRRALPGVGGMELATGQLAVGAAILLPFAVASGAPSLPSAGGLVSVIGLATLSTALAWPIFFRVLAHTTPTAASTVTFIVPAFAILWGALFLAEPVGPALIVGFGMILVSLVLVLGLRLPVQPIAIRVAAGGTRAWHALRAAATA